MIVDAGILYALADADDDHHDAARLILARPDEKLVPEPVIVETDYLILSRLGVEAELAFLRTLAGRWFSIESPGHEDRLRATELVAQYREARIGYVDAVIVAMAERLGESIIATVDRRRFGSVRPRHVDGFTLVP